MRTALIFGGAGFIGIHFTDYLLRHQLVERVIVADLKSPESHAAFFVVAPYFSDGRLRNVICDVRNSIADIANSGVEDVVLIANFAAVHREPGHTGPEYFETNIPGAENVCAYAGHLDCKSIIFTSSISPYGPSEDLKDENSIPTPETAYGGSKLAAELIHKSWALESAASRRLLIVRPGVVFGPGEGGNVSRLVKMVSRGFFPFAGNKDTRKAGIYVRELCRAMYCMFLVLENSDSKFVVANMTMDPCPSVSEYVEAASIVASRKVFTPSLNQSLLLGLAGFVGFLCSIFRIKTSINKVRVRKLFRSNNIKPSVLLSSDYVFQYSLIEAFADWKNSLPDDWSGK